MPSSQVGMEKYIESTHLETCRIERDKLILKSNSQNKTMRDKDQLGLRIKSSLWFHTLWWFKICLKTL